MDRKDFDQIFDEAFEHAAGDLSATPDFNASWKKVERMLEKKNKRKKVIHKFKVASGAAAIFIIGGITLGNPTVTKAFNPFYNMVKELRGNVSTFIFGSDDSSDLPAKTVPPNEAGMSGSSKDEVQSSEIITFDQAKKLANFRLPLVQDLPVEYQMDKVEVFRNSKNIVDHVQVSYKKEQNKGSFSIIFDQLGLSSMLSSEADKTAGNIEKVDLNHGKGYLSFSQSKKANLDFMYSGIYVTILGDVNKDEVISIANHLK